MNKARILHSQVGVGLFEVLVALLVISIGFLLSANMQLTSLRINQDSYYQSQAMTMVNDIMDRMRYNSEGVTAGYYDNMTTGSNAVLPNCGSSGCNSQELASLDYYVWSGYLNNLEAATAFVPLLPVSSDGQAASAAISVPDANGVYNITLSWRETDEASETVSVRFTP